MSTNWNLYLSRYQQARGGHFFGALEDDYDCHLILTEGESSPILVWIDTDPGDGCYEHNILARTMIKLDQTRELNISPRSLVGGGLMSVAGLVKGGLDFEQTEATRGRIITGSDKSSPVRFWPIPAYSRACPRGKRSASRSAPLPAGRRAGTWCS